MKKSIRHNLHDLKKELILVQKTMNQSFAYRNSSSSNFSTAGRIKYSIQKMFNTINKIQNELKNNSTKQDKR